MTAQDRIRLTGLLRKSPAPAGLFYADGVVSTLNVRRAGVRSGFLARSNARTEKECAPSASGGVVRGLLQGLNGPASSLHLKVEPLWLAVNPNVGVRSWVTDPSAGPAFSVV